MHTSTPFKWRHSKLISFCSASAGTSGVRHVTQGSIPSETERTGRRFFGSRAYLMPKGKGDCSMLLKHGEAKAL
jgi:hypothetical protein